MKGCVMLMRKITKNQTHIKAYIMATDEQQKRVKDLLNNYLHSSKITLSSIAPGISQILNSNYDRKKIASLLVFLKFPKKEKSIEQNTRTASIQKQSKDQRDKYAISQLKKLNDLGCDVNQFKREWNDNSFLFFKTKYGLSEYNVSSIVSYLKMPKRKLVKNYVDVLNELKNYNFGYSEIYNFYVTRNNKKEDLQKLISRIIGWEIGDKRLDKLLKKLNIKKSNRGISFARGQRSRALLDANLHKLERAGYTLESLAHRYENDQSLTKKTLLKELNSTLTKNDQPFTDRWLTRHLDPLLTKSRLGSVSREELEFRNVLIKEFPEKKMETSVRDLISPYEIDIYYPDEKLGIEFNGDYWHSDKYMTINHNMIADEYHRQKFNKCKQAGITLLFVWEADWNDNGNEVLQAIEEYMNTKKVSPILTKFSNEDE